MKLKQWLIPIWNSPTHPGLCTHVSVFIVNRIQIVTSGKETCDEMARHKGYFHAFRATYLCMRHSNIGCRLIYIHTYIHESNPIIAVSAEYGACPSADPGLIAKLQLFFLRRFVGCWYFENVLLIRRHHSKWRTRYYEIAWPKVLNKVFSWLLFL